MLPEEKEICIYLKSLPGQFISGREIARRAGGKSRHREDPQWAAPILTQMVEKRILESDATGHYRLIMKDDRKISKKKWVSPHVKAILERSGKDFTHVIPDEDLPPE
ncbi:MAG: hypothetical protein JWM99_737 [Verrucomicrobiales bacterium]|jgi:hypothetical protein|nr:hypothetical protein [Verrucomicrobiales bacterium]